MSDDVVSAPSRTTSEPTLGELLRRKLSAPPEPLSEYSPGTTALGKLLREKLDAQPVQHAKRTFYPAAHPSAVDVYEVKS